MARQMIRWNNGLVLSKIEELYDEGIDLRTSKIQEGPHRKVYRAACSRFKGGWRGALSKAGIKYEQLEDAVIEERRQKLLAEIKQAYDDGVKLDSCSIIKNKSYSRLYWGAKSFYKGRVFWENTLRDAGLDPYTIVRQQRWDKKKVKLRLTERRIMKKPLNQAAVKSDDPALYKACINHFDSFDDALRYAGFKPEKIRKSRGRYTDTEIITIIITYSLSGTDLSVKSIMSKKNKGSELRRIFYSAGRRFSGWYSALEMAGLDPNEYRKRRSGWDKDVVEYEIICLFEDGEPLNAEYVQEKHNPLYKAAYNHYGSWKLAIEAAGLDYNEVRKGGIPLSRTDIIAAIKGFAEEGRELNAASVSEDKDPNVRRVYMQANRKFGGGWDEALENAGFDPVKIRLKKAPYNVYELSEIIKGLDKKGTSLKPSDLRGTENYKYYHAVMKRCSDWPGYLDSIGIDSSKHVKITDWKNGEAVLEHLREMFSAGIVPGMRGRDPNLYAAMLSYFGGIREAAEKAGLVYSRSGRVTEKMLDEDPKIIGILYGHNKDFLRTITGQVYYHSISLNLPVAEFTDMLSQSFILFRNNLTDKPPGMDFRHFLYKSIYHGLIDMNARRFNKAYTEKSENVDELRGKAVI